MPDTEKGWYGDILGLPVRAASFFGARRGTRKGGTSPQTGAKSVRWTLFSPWESPSDSRRIRYGCGWNLNMSGAEKSWYGGILGLP